MRWSAIESRSFNFSDRRVLEILPILYITDYSRLTFILLLSIDFPPRSICIKNRWFLPLIFSILTNPAIIVLSSPILQKKEKEISNHSIDKFDRICVSITLIFFLQWETLEQISRGHKTTKWTKENSQIHRGLNFSQSKMVERIFGRWHRRHW